MSDQAETLRKQLKASFKNRALVYLEVYRVLAEEYGAARAKELLIRAIYRRGEAVGKAFRKYAPGDLAGLEKAFLDFIPDSGRMFDPKVIGNDGETLEILLRSCPLKDAWEDEGLSAEERALMCEIAGKVDNGTFESAGFKFRSETWKQGSEGCCHLFIQKGQ